MNSPPVIARRGWLMILLGWVLAFFVVVGFYRLVLLHQYNPNRLSVLSLQDGELVLEKNESGHYLIEGTLNGVPVTFLVDTGATQVAVSQATAQRIGLPQKSRRTIQTAAGTTEVWTTDINELQVGFLRFHDLQGVIVPELEGVVLLGMNALEQLHITQSAGILKLRPPADK